MTDYLTRPKAGAPTTINIGIEILGEMLSPVPIYWLAPILANLSPIDLDTADLCAAAPPPPESWTVADLIRHLDPEQTAFEDAKLVRMARAGVWTTYCEFYPVETPTPNTWDATPQFLGSNGFGGMVYNSDPITWRTVGQDPQITTSGPMRWEDVWFYTIWKKCIVSPDPLDQIRPELHHFNNANGNVANVDSGTWPFYVGDEHWAIILPQNVFMENCAPPHRWGMTSAKSGEWIWNLIAWGRQVPPQPEPWPAAPTVETAFQFTEEQAAKIVTMSDEWATHRITGALVPGMLDEIEGDVANVQAGIDQLLIEEPPPEPPQYTIYGPPIEFGETVEDWDLMENAYGILLEVTVPPEWPTMGGMIPLVWDAGYVQWGKGGGVWASKRVKHPNQFFFADPGSTVLRIQLRPGITGRYSWVAPPAF